MKVPAQEETLREVLIRIERDHPDVPNIFAIEGLYERFTRFELLKLLKRNNILTLSDSYKVTHWRQLRTDMRGAHSFMESRGGRYPKTVWKGLQWIMAEYLEGVVVTEDRILEAKALFAEHFGDPTYFNEAGWRYIMEKHGGRLPIEICSVLEGSVVDTHNVLMRVVNTDCEDEEVANWIVGYIEGLLLHTWYATSVATQSYYMKLTLLKYLELTGDPSLIYFKLHDFGFRGVSSVESARTGGCAHLVNFKGTDTLEALRQGRYVYQGGMPGYSVAAAEHFTITSWGRTREADAYRHMLEEFPTGIVAVVSDSYNIFNACENIWGKELRDMILGRNGTLVVRPDSGDPATVVVQVLDILGDQFGYERNAKGYKVLDPHIRVIQGDGIDWESLEGILVAMEKAGWSADNVAFGSGGGLLQKLNRDTQKFAFKCSAGLFGDHWEDVFKDPVTDTGKVSKKGRLALTYAPEKERYETVRLEDLKGVDQLVRVFYNGDIVLWQTLDEIRERTWPTKPNTSGFTDVPSANLVDEDVPERVVDVSAPVSGSAGASGQPDEDYAAAEMATA